jgi:hypothetical protein
VTLVYAPAAGRRRAAWVVVALVAGGGLAAFFWLPVALEWRLVVGDRMIQMGYAFTRQFILPRQILGYPGTKIVPGASLGEVVPRLLAVATGLALAGWRRMTAARWRLVAALWLVAAVGVFMSGAASTPVWNVLPLLYRIQFPWRFLVVIVVATAGLAGCVPMLSTPLAVVGVAMLAWSWAWAAPMRTTDFPLPETGAEIVRLSCRPDIADEWMPRGAKAFYGKRRPPPTEATCAPDCRVDSLERAPGALRARVETNRLALVTLPHYYFPVGWTATLDGVPTPIQPTRDGLMTAIVAHGGVLELRWATTPGRRWGVLVSALTLACLAAMVWCRLPA